MYNDSYSLLYNILLNKSLYADKITFMTLPQRYKNFTI